jgi:hypothetical protein
MGLSAPSALTGANVGPMTDRPKHRTILIDDAEDETLLIINTTIWPQVGAEIYVGQNRQGPTAIVESVHLEVISADDDPTTFVVVRVSMQPGP